MVCSFVSHAVELIGGLELMSVLFDQFRLTIGVLIRTEEQVKYIEFGGNSNCRKFLEKYGLQDMAPAYKYRSVAAQAYREYVI